LLHRGPTIWRKIGKFTDGPDQWFSIAAGRNCLQAEGLAVIFGGLGSWHNPTTAGSWEIFSASRNAPRCRIAFYVVAATGAQSPVYSRTAEANITAARRALATCIPKALAGREPRGRWRFRLGRNADPLTPVLKVSLPRGRFPGPPARGGTGPPPMRRPCRSRSAAFPTPACGDYGTIRFGPPAHLLPALRRLWRFSPWGTAPRDSAAIRLRSGRRRFITGRAQQTDLAAPLQRRVRDLPRSDRVRSEGATPSLDGGFSRHGSLVPRAGIRRTHHWNVPIQEGRQVSSNGRGGGKSVPQ